MKQTEHQEEEEEEGEEEEEEEERRRRRRRRRRRSLLRCIEQVDYCLMARGGGGGGKWENHFILSRALRSIQARADICTCLLGQRERKREDHWTVTTRCSFPLTTARFKC